MPKENFLPFLDMFQNAHHFNIFGGIFNVVSDADQSVRFSHLIPRIMRLTLRLFSTRSSGFCIFNVAFYLPKRVTSSFARFLD
jgi:hypothetical protein